MPPKRRSQQVPLLQKQLLAVVDGATTMICLNAAGQIRDLDQPFTTLAGEFELPPFHIHCRSIAVPYVQGVIRRARREANAEIRRRPVKEKRRGPDGFEGQLPPPPPVDAPPQEDQALPRPIPAASSRLPGRLLGWLSSLSGLRRVAARLVRGRRGDRVLEEMLRHVGADGPPRVVSAAELADLVAAGARPVWRGIIGPDAEGRAEQLRSGPPYAGFGIYGNGIHVTSTSRAARRFAGAGGVVVAAVLLATAAVVAWPELEVQVKQIEEQLSAAQRRRLAPILADPGRVAAALGYQAVLLPNGDVLVLDRAALAVAR
jgi:hypothetical protein